MRRAGLQPHDTLGSVPFTLAHGAAALPFRRTRLEISALIAGCFTPDFLYFLRLAPRGHFGHTLPGLFLFDLPAGLAALFLFHAYARQPLSVFLPVGVRERITPGARRFAFGPPARFALIALSILVGAATHILWDSFTHRGYWPYSHWSFLRRRVQVPLAGPVQICKLLQHGSTVVGLAILAVWVVLWYRATQPSSETTPLPYSALQRSVILVVVPLLAVVAAFGRALLGDGNPLHHAKTVPFFVDAGISAVTFFTIGILLCGAFFRTRQTKARIEPGA
jgi:membrane-bound metal-dependent hydrolase YbcI (DUF457 family)